jgi:hypothetical protein
VAPGRRLPGQRRRRAAREERDRAPDRPPAGELPIDRRPELLPDDPRRARRGAVELVLASLAVAAIAALVVWFLFFAHNPLVHP